LKKQNFVVCPNVSSKPLPLSEIKTIKETKKRRKAVGKVFDLLHGSMLKKAKSSNMILFHEEYKEMFGKELELVGEEFEINDEMYSNLYEISLWRMIRDGFSSYIDLDKCMFITRRAPEFTLLEKIRICLKGAPLSVGTLFGKLELPMIWYSKYETMLKHMKHYKRISIEDELVFLNKTSYLA
jgi:hypothetical protein